MLVFLFGAPMPERLLLLCRRHNQTPPPTARRIPLFFAPLSDEGAVQTADWLHELAARFEQHYLAQILRHHRAQTRAMRRTPQQHDLFDPGEEREPF